MILHIAKPCKFTVPFFDFLQDNFDVSGHEILGHGSVDWPANLKIKNSRAERFAWVFSYYKKAKKAEKIILHGYFGPLLILGIFFFPLFHKKIYWLVWGGDLYTRVTDKRNVKWWIMEMARRFSVPRFGFIVTSIDGDYQRVVDWYGAKGKRIPVFTYPAGCLDFQLKRKNSERAGRTKILVGNSAFPSNCHDWVFEQLSGISNDDFDVICPLSYGDNEYAEKIEARGKELFGERFKAIRDFMPYEEYVGYLSEVDIGIFANNRQQGLSNIRLLVAMGKKVFVNPEVSSFQHLQKQGVKVFDINSMDLDPVFPESDRNAELMLSLYSRSTLKHNLEILFDKKALK